MAKRKQKAADPAEARRERARAQAKLWYEARKADPAFRAHRREIANRSRAKKAAGAGGAL
jgi:hypothetical protein